MSAAGSLLVAVPVAALALLTVAATTGRGRGGAPYGSRVVRAALLIGAFAVLTVEVLGALRRADPTRVRLGLAALPSAAAAAAPGWRHGRTPRAPWRPRPGSRSWAPPPRHRAGPGAVVGRPRRTGRWRGGRHGAGSPIDRRHRPGRASWRPPAGAPRRSTSGVRRPGERLLAGTVAGLVLVELLVALLAEPNNFDSQTYHLPKVEHWVAQGDLTSGRPPSTGR